MARCSFCNTDIPRGTGLLFVNKAGKSSWFCSKKCEKHVLKLKRKPQNMKWVTSTKK